MDFREMIIKLHKLRIQMLIIAIILLIILVSFLLINYFDNFVVELIGVIFFHTIGIIYFIGLSRFDGWLQRNRTSIIADSEELRREDDVLLQGTTFAAAILFFYVNLSLNDQNVKLILSSSIAISALSFYCVRAYAKVKNRVKLRYNSIILLFFAVGSQITSFIIVTFQPLYFFHVKNFSIINIFLLSLIGIAIFNLVREVRDSSVKYFKVRYGLDKNEKVDAS